MRRMVKIAAAILALLLLCGCQSQAKLDKQVHGKLRGSWETTVSCNDETIEKLLKNIDLTKTERDLVAVDTLEFVKIAHFDDGIYRFELDIDGAKQNVRLFYQEVFAQLYEKRTQLGDVHSADLEGMGEEEFLDFYGALYGYISGEKMLDGFAATAFDYDAMQVMEAGQYRAERKNLIHCTPDGEGDSVGTVRFSVSDDTLVLTFANGDETYTRIVK